MPNESHLHAGQPAGESSSRGPGYEVRDTKIGAIITFLIGLTLLMIVVEVAMGGLLSAISSGQVQTPVTLTQFNKIMEQKTSLVGEADARLGPGAKLPIDSAIDRLATAGIPPISPGRTSVDVNSHSGKSSNGSGTSKDRSVDMPRTPGGQLR